MLLSIVPKLPMRQPMATQRFYIDHLGFTILGDYGDYLLLEKEKIEIHFFLHAQLVPEENDGQVYLRVLGIESLYLELQQKGVSIHPNAPLSAKPWGMKEFSLLDPDSNLLTFGEAI